MPAVIYVTGSDSKTVGTRLMKLLARDGYNPVAVNRDLAAALHASPVKGAFATHDPKEADAVAASSANPVIVRF